MVVRLNFIVIGEFLAPTKHFRSLDMFYIAFDGFDLFKLHFATREAAQKHLDENFMKLARHCQYSVAVCERR